MYDVKGKWALITGAARGIGYLTAKFMASRGCNLILHSRDVSHTDKVLSEVLACGVSARSVAADLNDPDSVQRMLAEIDGFGIDVDIVLNNAGLQIAYRTDFFKTPVSDYEISFRVNTIAPAMICYHFLPKMIARGTGRILNTTSGIALSGALGACGPPRSVRHQPGSVRLIITSVPCTRLPRSMVILSSAALLAE